MKKGKLKKGDTIVCHDERDREETYQSLSKEGLKVIKLWKFNKPCLEVVESEVTENEQLEGQMSIFDYE